jgi:aldehyde:ferredoxin oxidoreductase
MINKGYAGKLLRVDLTRGKISSEELEENFYRQFLGGRGFIAYFLLKELSPGIDPFDPENRLIIACGPATGLPIAGFGRHSIGAKSPLTGGYGEAESGGFFGAELKKAGFDIIVIIGKAKKPVYLWINNDEVEIRDATHLWGKDTEIVEDLIHKDLSDDKVRIAQIGVAGENLIRFASIMNDITHAAARGGIGAVMGSKNLKAIAVRGTNKINSADSETIAKLAKELIKDKTNTEALTRFGTVSSTAGHGKTGNLPVRNFRDGYFEGVDKIDGKAIYDNFRVGSSSCFACYVRCDSVAGGKTKWGEINSRFGGPEYETVGSLGSCCGISDLSAIIIGNQLCNKYGMDTISCGVTISFAMECYELGLIDKKVTDGLELRFGNSQAMIQMIENIAHRNGIGDILAEGTKRASQKIGEPAIQYAMQVKGMEIPMHDPRYKKGLGLGLITNPAGPDHACSVHDTILSSEEDLSNYKCIGVLNPIPTSEISDRKVASIYKVGLVRHLSNNMVFCTFVPHTISAYRDILNAATGWDMTVFEMFEITKRTLTLAHIFDLREGISTSDDIFPKRIYTNQNGGPLEGVNIDEFESAKKLLYEMWGWDPETSIPTRACLSELDIQWAASYLQNNGNKNLMK